MIPEAATTRWLDEQENFFGEDDEYSEFNRVGADSVPSEDGFEMPLWGLMIILAVVASVITGGAFYLSYRQEWCCGVHNKEDDEIDLEEGAKKIPTKTFQDSTRFERLTPSVALQEGDLSQTLPEEGSDTLPGTGTAAAAGDEEKNNSTRTSDATLSASHNTRASTATNSMRSSTATGGTNSMRGSTSIRSSTVNSTRGSVTASIRDSVTLPRCVLCSKIFQIGEDVTHSSNPACHHEYHEACLQKHWLKGAKENKGKCPVCKQEYVIECLAPSEHFSSHMDMSNSNNKQQQGRRNSASANNTELEPFAE